MRINIYLAKMLIKASRLVRSAAILSLRSDDLIRFSRMTYERPDIRRIWAQDALIDEGLNENERDLVARLPQEPGELLLLGMGTGREALCLGRAGFHVTGVDFVEDYLRVAEKKATALGVALTCWLGDISSLKYPADRFDVIWFSGAMYSTIPTRKRRIRLLQRLYASLRPRGVLVCQFHLDPAVHESRPVCLAKKALSLLLLSDGRHESGDLLWRNTEFIHAFKDEAELTLELTAAGFEKCYFTLYGGGPRGGSLWQKP